MNRLKKDTWCTLKLAFPIIIENTLQTLLGTTDTYFAGQLTDTAIAGINITNIIMNIFISFFTAVSIGTTAIVTRSYGKKDYEKTNKSMVQSIIIGFWLGLTIGIICFIFYKQFLMVSKTPKTIIEYATPYYFVVAIPSIFLCLQLILSSCLRAVKDTKTPMYITGLSNILNILLDTLFIHLGYGVLGLALATTLSRIIGMLLLFYKLQRHDTNIKFCKKDFVADRKLIKTILTIGIPAGAEKLIMRIGQLLYNNMIISISVTAYAAHNIAGTIESYSYIPAMGFGLAASTLVGTSLGEQKIEDAKKYTYISYLLSAICMIIIGAVFYIFAKPLASLFTTTKETQLFVASVLRIIAFFQPFSALVQVMTNSLQGAGDTKFPMYSTLIGIWGIRLGIGYLLAIPFRLGLKGVWYAYAFDLVIRGLILLIRFYNGKWEEIIISVDKK